ncbi:YCF48-related protein [Ideonella sp.]|uniref:YCF48-related protein n=1 Tax=Ideonella sp. TaxID=1929293 RepID=UPI00351B2FB7
MPLLLLIAVGLWMRFDMQQIPEGQRDFAWGDLQHANAWLKPVAFAPQKLRETIISPAATLNSVYCVNSSKCWAVGNVGTILATTDGGASWQPQASGSSQNLTSVNFNADGTRGWAVGEGGTILATTNGGAYWKPQASGSPQNLTSVSFSADGTHGWAVGEGGTILATTDGGASWKPQANSSSQRLTSVSFSADGAKGWAVGSGSTILATTDGGASWKPQVSGNSEYLSSVSFTADGTRGWAVGWDGTILATTDGGASWKTQASGSSLYLSSVSFSADGTRGWAVGVGGTILATTNGGFSWKSQASGSSQGFRSVSFTADGSRDWAVGEGGTILATTDGGASWKPQASGSSQSLNSVSFSADGTRGWAVGDGGTILATTDGGASWKPQASGSSKILNSVSFSADGTHGWAVGDSGAILATTDGGVSWKPQANSSSQWLTSVSFSADGAKGWAVGAGGTILATTDGGASWKPQASGSSQVLTSVSFSANGTHGWAAGYDGIILATADGGASWVTQSSSTPPWVDAGVGDLALLLPSPASWLALVSAIAWLALCLASISTQLDTLRHGDEGGVHDNPIDHPDDDRLAMAGWAKALAMLLRNQDTAPPLAVAVCAPWGMGKSSLLRMLARELKATDAHPVWFNAWHYREDTQLLAALMAHIKQQAGTSGLTLQGLRFRLHLLWLRVLRQWWPLALLVGVAALALLQWPEGARLLVDAQLAQVNQALGASLPAWLLALAAPLKQLAPAAGTLLALGLLLHTLASKLSPFTAPLQKLMAKSEVADTSSDAGKRYLFQREFEEVCQALGKGKLVLIIDDLDRCDPEQIDKVMSTLNFLFSSADCHAVLGMDWHYVKTAVGLAYKDMAKALQPEAAEAAGREHFGERFLRKIVQLRLSLPAHSAASVVLRERASGLPETRLQPATSLAWRAKRVALALRRLWRGRRQQAASAALRSFMGSLKRGVGTAAWALLAGLRRSARRWSPGAAQSAAGRVLVLALVFGCTWGVGQLLADRWQTTAAAAPQLPGATTTQPVPPPTTTQPDKERRPVNSGPVTVLQPEPNTAPTAVWWAGPVLGLLAAGLWLMWASQLIRDSASFREAILAWQQALRPVLSTPREWRRLQNMARFAAMSVRVAEGDGSGWQQLLLRWRHRYGAWLRNRPSLTRTLVEQQEALIVSLLAADLLAEGDLVKGLHAHLSACREAAGQNEQGHAFRDGVSERSQHTGWPKAPTDVTLDWLTSYGEALATTSGSAVDVAASPGAGPLPGTVTRAAWYTSDNPWPAQLRQEMNALLTLAPTQAPWLTLGETAAFLSRLRALPTDTELPDDAQALKSRLIAWQRWLRFANLVDIAHMLRKESRDLHAASLPPKTGTAPTLRY